MVNVLDVPVQGEMLFGGNRNVSSSSLDSAVFTLDPRDKYLPSGVRRATTTSAVHARKARLPATTRPMGRVRCNGSIGAEIVPQTSKTSQDLLPLERQHSLLSVFHRMRQTRSAGSNAKPNLVWSRKIFSRAGQRKVQEAPDPVPEITNLHDHVLAPSPMSIGDAFKLPIQLPSTADDSDRAPTAFIVSLKGSRNSVCLLEQLSSSDQGHSAPPKKGEQELEDGDATSSVRILESSFLSSHKHPLEQLRDTLSYFAPTIADERNDMELSDHLGRLDLVPDAVETLADATNMPVDKKATTSKAFPSTESPGSFEADSHALKYGYAESLASYAASANFSPCLAPNTIPSGPTSPYHLSQPETPFMSEFGDELLPTLRDSESLSEMGKSNSSDPNSLSTRPSSRAGPPNLSLPHGGDAQTSHVALGGFQGYSLPNDDHASVLTIRKLPSLTLKKTDGASPFAQQNAKQDLVHSWNDGSEHHMTALGELVDDLGYLGGVII